MLIPHSALDVYSISAALDKLKVLLPLAITILFVLFSTISAEAQTTVTKDDFFILDHPQFINAYENDTNPGGYLTLVRAPSHGSVYIGNGYGCNICTAFNGFSPYTGFDSFDYKYEFVSGPPFESNTSTVYLALIGNDDAQNAGDSCRIPNPGSPGRPPASVGRPVNITNGNMWLNQKDYELPGPGEPIKIDRFYNSIIQSSGLFGFGWSTQYDESLIIYPDDQMLRFNAPDGRASYFIRHTLSDPFISISPDLNAKIVKNVDNTYTFTFKDGRTHKFAVSGRLLWLKDQTGNQTTLNYDGNGILTSITDAAGRSITISMNSYGNVAQVSDALGTVATYDYIPSSSKLQSVTYPDGSKFKFEYEVVNGKAYIKTVKDALDNILETHGYDPSTGKAITSETQGGVEKYTIDYVSPGGYPGEGQTTVTDARGNVTNYYHYRIYGTNLITKIVGNCSCGSGSQITQYKYDTSNSWLNLVKKTDAFNRDTDYTYDVDRNVTAITDVLGTRNFTYNPLGEVLTATDRMGGVTTNTFDSNGNLLTTKDPLNSTTTFTYTALGQPASIKDALNHSTALTWDMQGRLTKIVDANAKETNFGYDARARITSLTNAKNETTILAYDLNNRLNKVTYPDTNFSTIGYDLAGRRTSMTDELSHTTTYAFDSAYRFTGITDALNHATTYGYDLMSNLTSQTDALGNVTDLEYDTFNRLKKIKYPLASTGATRLEENYTFDTVGNLKTRVDTAGRTTGYDYDDANRLIKITNPLSEITQFDYNARSQMIKLTDALNQQYVYTYDPLGRELSETRAGTTMSFDYDSVGNRKKRTDYIGRVSQYSYDNLNRLTAVDYGVVAGAGGTSKQYNYDDLSRLVSAVNEAGTVAFTYDNRNRLKSETDVFGHVIENGYDAANRRTFLKIDGSVQTSYAYDNANRLITLTDESSQNFTFGYDIANRLISKAMPNGINSTFDFDGMSRLKELKHQSSSATLTDNQYSYNTANQISQITDLSETKIFGYDNVDRLTSMVNGSANESYSFDAVGNRTSSQRSATYGYQPFNKLTTTATANLNYDPNGNLVSKSEGSDFWHYRWDFENRLISASTRKQTVRYLYDALGRRARRHIPGGRENTKFTYDGLDVVMDDNAGVLTKYQNGPGIDNKLKLTSAGVSKYFLQDHLGSTVALTNSSGFVTEQTAYDSFGNPTNSGFSSRYQFTGREFDSFSGLQYSRARFYDPNLGRFISEDPKGFAGHDVNLYGYVRSNPLLMTDPSGEIPIWDNYWHYHYAKKCAETGIANACAVNGLNQSQEDLERMAQAAFDNDVGSVGGLRFKVGYANNEDCRQAEYYSGQVWVDAFPTNIQRVDPEGSVTQTLANVAKTRPASKLKRAWDWITSWF